MGALNDICFPLHNYERQDGTHSLSSDFLKLINSIGSNKFKLKGNQIFYISGNKQTYKERMTNIGKKEYVEEEKEKAGQHHNKQKKQKHKYDQQYKILKNEQNLWPLTEKFTFSKFFGLKFKLKFPIFTLRNYFGSKIALYFYFIGFLINRLFLIGLVGLFVSIAYLVLDILAKKVYPSTNSDSWDTHAILGLSQDGISWLFSIYVFIWGFRFSKDWKVFEKSFQILNGDIYENLGNQADRERAKIRNYHYKRSLISDELNTKSKDETRVILKFYLAMASTFFMIIISIGISIGILEVKRVLIAKSETLMEFDNIFFLPFQIGITIP